MQTLIGASHMQIPKGKTSNTVTALIISEQFWPEYTGWVKQTLTMATKVSEVHFHVFCRENIEGDTRDLPGNLTIDRLPPHRLKRGLCNQLVFILLSLGRLLRQRNQVNILYFPYTFFPAFVFMVVGRLLKLPVVARISGQELVFNSSVAARLRLATLRHVTALIVLNHKDGMRLKNLGVGKESIHWIPNGVNIDRFTPQVSLKEHKICQAISFIPSDHVVITFAGIVCRRKGVIELLEAFESLCANLGTTSCLVIAGPYEGVGEVEPTYVARVKQRVEALSPNVVMTGNIDDMPALFKASNIFVLPSIAEGMPNVLLEAMATGLPCIATSIPGIIEVIIDGENGLLVTPGAPRELSKALACLVQNSERRRALGQAARQTIERQFSIDHTAKQYQGVLHRVAASTHRSTLSAH